MFAVLLALSVPETEKSANTVPVAAPSEVIMYVYLYSFPDTEVIVAPVISFAVPSATILIVGAAESVSFAVILT